jgi:hypothetical protein
LHHQILSRLRTSDDRKITSRFLCINSFFHSFDSFNSFHFYSTVFRFWLFFFVRSYADHHLHTLLFGSFMVVFDFFHLLSYSTSSFFLRIISFRHYLPFIIFFSSFSLSVFLRILQQYSSSCDDGCWSFEVGQNGMNNTQKKSYYKIILFNRRSLLLLYSKTQRKKIEKEEQKSNAITTEWRQEKKSTTFCVNEIEDTTKRMRKLRIWRNEEPELEHTIFVHKQIKGLSTHQNFVLNGSISTRHHQEYTKALASLHTQDTSSATASPSVPRKAPVPERN